MKVYTNLSHAQIPLKVAEMDATGNRMKKVTVSGKTNSHLVLVDCKLYAYGTYFATISVGGQRVDVTPVGGVWDEVRLYSQKEGA
jgi:hypothetical protein